jgi:hypothetical protein
MDPTPPDFAWNLEDVAAAPHVSQRVIDGRELLFYDLQSLDHFGEVWPVLGVPSPAILYEPAKEMSPLSVEDLLNSRGTQHRSFLVLTTATMLTFSFRTQG